MANRANMMLKGMQRQIQADRQAFGMTACKAVTAMALVVLHDEFGFGPKRLQRFQNLVENQADCITGGFCTLNDLEGLADELAKRVGLEDSSKL
ncbi:hypothetical protein [Niameybacter massiliensis]|uniref:hypothetical protein n=1 Tax=Niameybacter massiliensis TaxID=1658108 RepID=UPI0006B4EEA5|nr:hypothetical protein [Niameybacter massiliensis]